MSGDHRVAERAGGVGWICLDQLTELCASSCRSARAQLAPPKPPPITTTRARAPCASAGQGRPGRTPQTRRCRSEQLTSACGVIGCIAPSDWPCDAGKGRGGRIGPPRRCCQAKLMFVVPSGIERMRLPVAAKKALSTGGAATQIVGSPTPPQKPPLRHDDRIPPSASRRCASSCRCRSSSARSSPSLTVHAAKNSGGQAVDERARDLPLDLRRIDRVARIGRGDDAVHLDLVAVRDGDFGRTPRHSCHSPSAGRSRG